MKRLLISLLAILTLSGVGIAQEVSDITVGYCNGEAPKKGDLSYSEADAYVSAAIYIPAGTVNTYAGNNITGIHAALASKLNIDEMTAWVRTSLDGENLAQVTITTESTPAIAKGWNDLMFATPLPIEGGNTTGLYLGYTYHQKGSCFGVAALTQPNPNGCFLKFGNEEWQDLSDERTASIEGYIQGDKLPKVNLSLIDVDAPDVFIIDRGNADFAVHVRNLATHTITGYDINLVNNGTVVDTHHVDTSLAYNQEETVECTLNHGVTAIGTGSGEITILVNNINGGDDEDMTDNSETESFSIVQHDFTRKILVEEFTTEQCPNCPRLAGYMHDSLAKDKYKDNVIAVCHHAGYYTDWLTTPFDSKYLWFFPSGGTYAPAMMVDRTERAEESPVWCPASSSEMENAWNKGLNAPAFVSLNITAGYAEEDNNVLRVTVNGSRSMADLCDNPVITVFVVEDNIKARSQAGGTADYTHQHVNRAVNNAWGDPLTFTGDDYTYNCEFAVSNQWTRENLQIVAFISNYDAEDRTDCEVLNTNNLLASAFSTTGVTEIENTEAADAEYFTISGLKVNSDNLTPGLYIRKAGAKTQKVLVK